MFLFSIYSRNTINHQFFKIFINIKTHFPFSFLPTLVLFLKKFKKDNLITLKKCVLFLSTLQSKNSFNFSPARKV